MKTLLKSIAIAVMLISVAGASAQELTRVHPDIQKYTEMYNLNDVQVKELSVIYAETSAEGMKVEEEMKTAQLKNRETIKSATPSEKETMKSELDVLSKKRQTIKTERKNRMVALLDKEQMAIYKKNQGTSLEKEAVKKEAVKKEK